jgi:hypothetical protein
VIASVSTKAVTGMRIENTERGYITFMTMSCDARIMVLFDDTAPQVSVFGDIDLTAEHE